ncbi:MAG: hypothetical protein LBI86_05145 [Treponema sp.]|jgi:hypothetical protein|nr:hypothetical protein [Treponema sp.]
MFSREMLVIFAEVLSSWQVIVAAVIVLLYILLVNHVARLSHHPSFSMRPLKSRKKKAKTTEAAPEADSGENENDELGLEEE